MRGSQAREYYQKDLQKGNNKRKETADIKKKSRVRARNEKDASVTDVRRLYFDEGLPLSQIARKLGASPYIIRRIFKNHGWEARKPQDADEDIRRLYFDDRYPKSGVARKLGIANSTVHRAFERNQWLTRPPPKKGNPEDARKLYELGLTQKEIAKRLGVSRSTIVNYLRELGVKCRYSKYESDEERERARKENAKRRLEEVQELREKLFGTKCRICEVGKEKRKLAIHNKSGKEHFENALWGLPFLRRLNPEEWAALCTMCHRGAHWAHEELGMDWKTIESQLEQRTMKRTYQEAVKQNSKHDSQSTSNKKDQKQNLVGEVEDIRKSLFGDECYFCGTIPEGKRLVIHRKDSSPHRGSLLWSKERLRELKPEEWQALCTKHHRYVHWAMKNLGFEWDDIDSAFLRMRGPLN